MTKTFTGENLVKQKLDGFQEYSNNLNNLNAKEFSSFCFTAEVISESLQDAKQSIQSESYPQEALSKIIGFFSKRGELVLNLFSGNGDTLFLLDELERNNVGVEIDNSKIASYLKKSNEDQFTFPSEVINSDALDFLLSEREDLKSKFDFILMEPPKFTNKATRLNCLSSYSFQEYCSYISCCVNNSTFFLKKGRYVVVLLEDFYWKGRYNSPVHEIHSKVNNLLFKGLKIFVRDLPSTFIKYNTVYAPFKNHFYSLIFQKQ